MCTYYHVDCGRRLKAGQTIDLTLHQREITARNGRAQIFRDWFPDGVSQHGWEYLVNNQRKSPHQDTTGQIEALAELLRQAHYPHHISRYQAFFAFKHQEDAETFSKDYGSGIIWEVTAQHIAFKSDMRWLDSDDSWIHCFHNLNAYWQGRHTANPLVETLLKPPVTVVRPLSTLDDDSSTIKHHPL